MGVPLLLVSHLLAHFAAGQLDPLLVEADYEYEALPSDPQVQEEFIPLPNSKFLEGLVIEAGRHVLFPQLYSSSRELPSKNISPKFFEMRGQPELEQVYTNRQTRRLNCPEDCTVYRPVCGSDGKVYPSECHLHRENCGLANVTRGPWAKCRGRHYLCPAHCLDISDPVCASDGRIYHNICVMRKRNCGKLLQVLPLKKCYEETQATKLIDGCPERCPEISKPVCGSNGVIYFNECFMKLQTCGMDVFAAEMSGCVFVPRCPEVCLPFHDPVCGSDGRIYINQCRMLQENCGKEMKKMPATFCVSAARGSSVLASRP